MSAPAPPHLAAVDLVHRCAFVAFILTITALALAFAEAGILSVKAAYGLAAMLCIPTALWYTVVGGTGVPGAAVDGGEFYPLVGLIAGLGLLTPAAVSMLKLVRAELGKTLVFACGVSSVFVAKVLFLADFQGTRPAAAAAARLVWRRAGRRVGRCLSAGCTGSRR